MKYTHLPFPFKWLGVSPLLPPPLLCTLASSNG